MNELEYIYNEAVAELVDIGYTDPENIILTTENTPRVGLFGPLVVHATTWEITNSHGSTRKFDSVFEARDHLRNIIKDEL